MSDDPENTITIVMKHTSDPNEKAPLPMRKFQHEITHRFDLTVEAAIIAIAIILHGIIQ